MSIRAAACIVIPCYRADLQHHEMIALDRCDDVLAAHPRILVTSQSLDVQQLQRRHADIQIERFPDEYFAGIAGYNRLLLTDDFYARFAQYEYLLVHQLDCFVFSDQLLNWCDRGYDYIGAPWLPPGPIPGIFAAFSNDLRRARATRENTDFSLQYFYAVGNGGFSLRRISAMRDVLRELAPQAEEYRKQTAAICNEDIFFSIEANRSARRIKKPGFKVASAFAWETEPEKAAAMNHGRLPFGAHGWNKLHRGEWQTIFAKAGYSLDEMLSDKSQ